MKRLVVLLLVPWFVALGPAPASAQADLLDVGVHLVRASDIFDGSTGIGGQLAVNLPGFPLTVRAAVDRFFPDCPEPEDGGDGDCGAWGFTVDGNLSFPLPVLTPYASAGIVRRSVDPGDPLAETAETGLALGGGLELSLLGLNVFGEARREFVGDLDDQWMFRLGLLF